jgi:hypothetical protein
VTHPTPYPDINAVLWRVQADVQPLLGAAFLGLYLSGSLASGDFDPHRSDIDFVVVTSTELPAALLPTLAAMHARITASGLPWATKLEGSYMSLHALRRYDPAQTQYPSLHVGGDFGLDRHGSDWIIQRYIIREHGVVVAGPNPQPFIDPVLPNDLRRAVQATLHEWWSPQLQQPVRLHSREYQAYAVLTMCRALYTLHHGAIVSKLAAARWAQATYATRWTTFIEDAVAWPHGPQPEDMPATLEFIRETLTRSQHYEIPKKAG